MPAGGKSHPVETASVLKVWTRLGLQTFWWSPSNKRLKKANQLGKYARHIRNACAHSKVILVDVLEQTLSPSSSITSLASTLNISRNILKYRKIHDIFSLIVLHREYCSQTLGKQRFKEFIKTAKRAKKHEKYYNQNPKIIEIYTNFIKTLVKLSKKWYHSSRS